MSLKYYELFVQVSSYNMHYMDLFLSSIKIQMLISQPIFKILFSCKLIYLVQKKRFSCSLCVVAADKQYLV